MGKVIYLKDRRPVVEPVKRDWMSTIEDVFFKIMGVAFGVGILVFLYFFTKEYISTVWAIIKSF